MTIEIVERRGAPGRAETTQVTARAMAAAPAPNALPTLRHHRGHARSGKIGEIASSLEAAGTKAVREQAIRQRDGATQPAEDIVPAVAREVGVDRLAKLPVFRLDRMKEVEREGQWKMRQHRLRHIDRAKIIARCVEVHSELANQRFGITAFVAIGPRFDHRQTSKPRRPGAERGRDNRAVEAARYTDEDLVEAGRPGPDAVLERGSQRCSRRSEVHFDSRGDMVPRRPSLLDAAARRCHHQPFAGEKFFDAGDARPASDHIDTREHPRERSKVDDGMPRRGKRRHVARQREAPSVAPHIAGHHSRRIAQDREGAVVADQQRDIAPPIVCEQGAAACLQYSLPLGGIELGHARRRHFTPEQRPDDKAPVAKVDERGGAP